MARPQWSDDELEALKRIAPGHRAALDGFCRDHPGHTRRAVISKLAVLRRRRQARDVSPRKMDLRIKPRPAAAWLLSPD